MIDLGACLCFACMMLTCLAEAGDLTLPFSHAPTPPPPHTQHTDTQEIDRLRWLIRARSCHDTTTALAAQLSSLNFDVAEPSGFASACKAAAAATEGGNIVIGRRLVDGRRLPAVTMRAEEDEEEGSGIGGIGVGAAPPLSAFERERLRAVLGFVVQGGLLPELFGELKEMMWQVWWDDWRAAATAAQEEGQAEQGEGGEQVQGEGAGEDA